jgi:sugar phosphate isomerase/epimerase
VPVRYRLGVSAFVEDGPAGHDWDALASLGVRHFELSMLRAGEPLPRVLGRLRPASFGVHWPLLAEDGMATRLLDTREAAFAAHLEAMRRRLRGSGAAYVLVHFSQREERWPESSEISRRLEALAALAAELGIEVVLEPKESVGRPDGLASFARRAPHLPAGVSLCLDTNDWISAARHLPEPMALLGARAAYFHLHAMHLRPDGSGLYLHAPPWVEPGPDPAWPEVLQPDPAEMEALAVPGRAATVQVEVHPRYRARMAQALDAVRRRLAAAGWIEEDA